MSQDPVFVNLGVDGRTVQVLNDPQQLNSHSYARGNPVTLSDRSGEALPFLAVPSAAAIIKLIGGGFLAKGIIQTVESFHYNIVLPRQYPNAFTPEQQREAPFRFAAEATLNVGTNAIEPVGAKFAADTFLTGLEYVPDEARKRNPHEAQSPYKLNVNQGPGSVSSPSGGGGFAPAYSSAGSGGGWGGYRFTSSQQQAAQGLVSTARADSFDAQAFVTALQQFVSAFSISVK